MIDVGCCGQMVCCHERGIGLLEGYERKEDFADAEDEKEDRQGSQCIAQDGKLLVGQVRKKVHGDPHPSQDVSSSSPSLWHGAEGAASTVYYNGMNKPYAVWL